MLRRPLPTCGQNHPRWVKARSCLSPQFTDAGLQHLGATHDELERVILRACPLINDNGMYAQV